MCRLTVRFLVMTTLADLLIGDSALLLYFREFRTRSGDSTIAPIFQNLLLFTSVLYCVTWKYLFLKTVAMIVRIKQDDNCSEFLKSDSHLPKKIYFICFNDSPSKVMKNAFYFILKALFVFKILKLLSWLFEHVEKTAWLER